MLERCREEVYPDVEDAEFYVADIRLGEWQSGVGTASVLMQLMVLHEQEAPWTLAHIYSAL